jgi:hypothetical protein
MDTGWKPHRRGEEMLAVHSSIKPKNQSLNKGKGKNDMRMETSLSGMGNMQAVYLSNHKSIIHQ